MHLPTLLTIGLLSLAPSMLLAQSYPEPMEAVIPPAPKTPRAAKAPRAPSAALTVSAPAPPDPPVPEAAQKPAAPPKPAAVPGPAVAPAAPAPPRPPGQMINVRIDVTLSDSKGSPKILTMTLADGESGMNRTTSVASTAEYSFNADARPFVVGNRIRLNLTADAVVPVEYDRPSPGATPRLALRQSQTIVLNDGESVEIARAADPTSDRAFALSVKATILR